MEKTDTRTLKPEVQEEIRIRCIKMVLKGVSKREISRLMGIPHQTITAWHTLYKKGGGFKALKKKVRGRRVGDMRKLTLLQESQIKQLIKDKTPDQLKLSFALWTRKAVMELVEKEFRIKLPIRSTGNYLKRWGYTPQKPLKRAYEQQPKAVQKWIDETYPKIEEKAKKEKAEIHWGDETGVNNQPNVPRGYSPKGKTPVLTRLAKKISSSMISSVTNRGKLRFMLFDGAMNVSIFKKFLTQLIKGSKQKIFLIVDNLRVHHANKLKPWLKKQLKKIELFYLPSYSPEKNPDEYVNQDVKAYLRNKPMAKTKQEMKTNLNRYMKSLQKKTNKIKKFFDHKEVKYACAA